MELRDLEYFAVVAEYRHLGRAAEALDLSTPALSKSLRRLERLVQSKLVKRTPKGVELTAKGEALVARVRVIRLAVDDAVREVTDLSQGRAGALRIGLHPAMYGEAFSLACTEFLKVAPNVHLTVTLVTSDTEGPALRNGELDLIVSDVPDPPYADIIHEHLFDDTLVVFASAAHPLAKCKTVTIAEVARERWVLTAVAVQVWRRLQRVFESKGLPYPQVVMRTSHLPLRDDMVASSNMLGFSSRRVLRQVAKRHAVVELPVKELTSMRPVSVSYRKSAYLSPAARRFIEMLQAAAKEIAR